MWEAWQPKVLEPNWDIGRPERVGREKGGHRGSDGPESPRCW